MAESVFERRCADCEELEAWKAGAVRVDSLHTGAQFEAINGRFYRVRRKETHVVHVEAESGCDTLFCSSALVHAI